MRQRFLKNKGQGFSQHELLEMVLYPMIPRANTNETAHRLLKRYGSLENLFQEGDYYEFRTFEGIGDQSAYHLSVLCKTFYGCAESKWKNVHLKSPASCKRFFINEFREETDDEVFMAACLGDDMQIIRCETIAAGETGQVQFTFAKLAKVVLRSSCRLVVLAHNHPRGFSQPSVEDIITTGQLRDLLSTIDVSLFDHIIISGREAYSMAEHHDF